MKVETRVRARGARRWVAALASAAALGVGPAAGQERPFVFTIATSPATAGPRWTVHYDAGYSERAPDAVGYDGMEQRVGFQGALGHGFTLVGQAAFGLAAKDVPGTATTSQVEVLKDVLAAAGPLRLAAGGGLRREWDGTSVLLGRLSAGRASAGSSLFANVRVERALARGRDGLDVVTSLGWRRRVAPAVHLGLEGVGEDLEGFWDAQEAEGGAKLFLGPSIQVAPPGGPWSFSVCGGPVLHAAPTGRESRAARALGAAPGGGYMVRASLAYSF